PLIVTVFRWTVRSRSSGRMPGTAARITTSSSVEYTSNGIGRATAPPLDSERDQRVENVSPKGFSRKIWSTVSRRFSRSLKSGVLIIGVHLLSYAIRPISSDEGLSSFRHLYYRV